MLKFLGFHDNMGRRSSREAGGLNTMNRSRNGPLRAVDARSSGVLQLEVVSVGDGEDEGEVGVGSIFRHLSNRRDLSNCSLGCLRDAKLVRNFDAS